MVSFDSQDAAYDDDGLREESIDQDPETLYCNILGDYWALRPIDGEYKFVGRQSSVISLWDMRTRR